MIKVEGILLYQTEKSYLIDCEGDKVWLPKSMVKYDKQKYTVEMPEWLYKKTFPEDYISKQN